MNVLYHALQIVANELVLSEARLICYDERFTILASAVKDICGRLVDIADST